MMAPWRPQPAREPDLMKMDVIQPFINSADAVLAQGLECSTAIGSLSMEEEAYRRKGVAAMVWLTGDIEGRTLKASRMRAHSHAGAVPASPKRGFPSPIVHLLMLAMI